MNLPPSKLADSWPWLKVAGIVVAVYVLTIHWWFTAPMLTMGQERAALIELHHDMQVELQRESGLREQQRQMQADHAGLQAWADLEQGTVTAQLGQRLDVWLTAGNRQCQSLSRTPGQEQASGRFRKSVLQIRLRCGMQGLSELIQRIEAESPLMRVENLEIATRRHMAANEAQNTGVDVTLDIAVYRHPSRGSK